MVKQIISWWSGKKKDKRLGLDEIMQVQPMSMWKLDQEEQHAKEVLNKIKEIRDKQREALRVSERLAKRYWYTLHNIQVRRKQIERDNQRRNHS